MGNSCASGRGVQPEEDAPRSTRAASTVPPVPILKNSLHAQGLAESRDPQPTITPRQIQVTPSKSEASRNGGWVMEETPRYSRKSGELLTDEQMSKRIEVEKSGRSIARRPSKDIEDSAPAEVLQDLLDGNARFMVGESDHPHQTFKRIQEIAPKQKPMAAILACADSRVPVELLFDQGFGDIFVCRIAGNIATAEEIASLEYAVLDLGVKVIMVLGHTSCGAVKAALSGKAFPGFIDSLVDHLDVAIVRAQSRSASSYAELVACQAKKGGAPNAALLDMVIRENALYQVARCKRSTIVLEAVKKGKLLVVPAIYDITTGEVKPIEA